MHICCKKTTEVPFERLSIALNAEGENGDCVFTLVGLCHCQLIKKSVRYLPSSRHMDVKQLNQQKQLE